MRSRTTIEANCEDTSYGSGVCQTSTAEELRQILERVAGFLQVLTQWESDNPPNLTTCEEDGHGD
jgi:hypothetical protein